MGFFDDDDDQPSPGSDAVQQQINQNNEQLEQKRKSLYAQRLDIIRSQGGQNWSPDKPTPTPAKSAGFPFPLWGFAGAEGSLIASALGQNRAGVAGKQPTVS